MNIIYIIIIFVLISDIIPLIDGLVSHNEFGFNKDLIDSLYFRNRMLLYPILGYWIYNVLDIKKINFKKVLLLMLLNIISIFIVILLTSCLVKNNFGNISGDDAQFYINHFVIINFITIMITIRYIFSKYHFSNKFNMIICSIGSATFGIYLIHLLLIERIKIFDFCFNKIVENLHLNLMISSLISCFCVMTIAYIIILALKRIPLIKKLI